MGDSSLGHGEPHPTRLTTSISTSSLDIKLLLCANRMQSLLSESVTLDSLCGNAADPLPAFPPSKLLGFSLIGLGDHLKFFSAVELTEELDTSTVIISTPTIPRLKCMFKECLSIKKWAENSTGCQAPGHVPWVNVQNQVAYDWIPEGSAFTPEKFSLALLKARSNRNKSFSDIALTTGPSKGDDPFKHSDSPDTVKAESYHTAQFSHVKSSLEDFQDDMSHAMNDWSLNQTSSKLSLPSLVVSDSYFTFPIPFESSSTLSVGISGTLARRRGKAGPPRLLGQRKTVFDLPYPDVPTAFLGWSPNESSDTEYHHPDLGDKPTLRFEEMINNLRLQCSTLGPQTPVADPSWNSRSPTCPLISDSELTKETPGCKDQPFTCVSNKLDTPEARSTSVPRPVGVRHLSRPRQCRLEIPAGTLAKDVQEAPKDNSRTMALSRSSTIAQSGSIQDESSMVRPQNDCPSPQQLRSAMVKASSTSTNHIFKKVRFAVTQNGLEELHLEWRHAKAGSAFDRPEAGEILRENGQNDTVSNKSQTIPIQRSTSWTQKPPWRDLRRVRSSPSSHQPRPHSLISKSTMSSMSEPLTESEDIKPEASVSNSIARSASSLGRHSLSRIIKGPIFSGRDGRRATLAMSSHGDDENAVRRESQSNATNIHQKRKSRMPIPLRNILTRFK